MTPVDQPMFNTTPGPVANPATQWRSGTPPSGSLSDLPMTNNTPGPVTLDPDLAFWPWSPISRWTFAGPPTTGTWPLGFIGVDNTATVWLCTASGSPGTWVAIAGAGGVGFINVKSYGAIGNNVADDTAAIRAAISAAQAAGGGIVFFPPGTYRITAALSVPTGVWLQGSDPEPLVTPSVSTINQATNGADIIDIVGSDTGVKNLRLTGVGAAVTGGIGWNVSGAYTNNLIQDCVIVGMWGAINVNGSSSTFLRNVNCSYIEGPVAVNLYNATGVTGYEVNCGGLGATTNAFVIDTATNSVTFYNCGALGAYHTLVTRNTGAGTGPNLLYFYNITSDHARETGVVLGGGAYEVKMIGGFITSSGTNNDAPAHGIDTTGFANQLDLIGLTVVFNSGTGLYLSADTGGHAANIGVINCRIQGNGTYAANTYNGIDFYGCSNVRVLGCSINGNAQFGINAAFTPSSCLVSNCTFAANGGPRGNLSGVKIRDNIGISPIGTYGVTVPASGTAVPAAAWDDTYYIQAGASTVTIAVSNAGGTNNTVVVIPANACVPVMVPAGSTMTPTYTTAPTWTTFAN